MHHAGDGLAVIIGGIRTGLRGHTDMAVGKGLPPDIALQAGIRPIGTPRRVAARAGLAIVIKMKQYKKLW
jgi:hypothetical protein